MRELGLIKKIPLVPHAHRVVIFVFGITEQHLPTFHALALRRWRLVKYLVSGGSSAFVQLALLYILTDVLGVWYLFSAIIAFIVAFFMSFTLHKFWTFLDGDMDVFHSQLAMYFTLAMINLSLTAGLMYLFVDIFHVWYFLAQIITSGLIAISSFYLYKKIIFRPR